MGRKKICGGFFCCPCRGLDGFDDLTHGFTVGYFLPRLGHFYLPRLVCNSFSSRARARSKASWFF